jgi:hypothetical protein
MPSRTDHEPQETPYEPPAIRVLGDVATLTEGPFGAAHPDAHFFHASS